MLRISLRVCLVSMVMLMGGVFVFGGGQKEESADAPPVITWYTNWDSSAAEDTARTVIDEFQKKNPGVKIDHKNIKKTSDYYVKLMKLAMSNEMPDIVCLTPHYLAVFTSRGMLREISSEMEKYGIPEGAYFPNVLELYKIDEKVMGLPLDTAGMVLAYNEDMFTAAGVEPFKEGWTWDDLRETGRKFIADFNGDGRTDRYAIYLDPELWPLKLKADTDHGIMDDYFKPKNYLLAESSSIASIQDYFNLWLVEKIAPPQNRMDDVKDFFIDGKAAMVFAEIKDLLRFQKKINKFKWNISPLPLGKTGKKYNRGDGTCLAVSATSKNAELAFQFLNYMAGPEGRGVELLVDSQQIFPALIVWAESERFLKPDGNLTGGGDLNKGAFLFGKNNSFSMYEPIHAVYERVKILQKSEFAEAIFGTITVAEVIHRIAPRIEEILAELGK